MRDDDVRRRLCELRKQVETYSRQNYFISSKILIKQICVVIHASQKDANFRLLWSCNCEK
jgi:hypothetical protein